MRVTVSGPPGSGTTTAAESLSSRFSLKHVSSGDVFRSMAEERGMTLAEFGRAAEKDSEIDKEVDTRQRELARNNDDLVLEGRLSGWMVEEPDLCIWLNAPIEVRAKRVADREEKTVEEALGEVKQRERSEAKRYEEIHGIDIDDLSIYDLIIDTSTWDEKGVAGVINVAYENLR